MPSRHSSRPSAAGRAESALGSGPITGLETPLITLRDVPPSRARDRRRYRLRAFHHGYLSSSRRGAGIRHQIALPLSIHRSPDKAAREPRVTPVTLPLVSAEPGRARPGPAPGAVPRRAPRDIGPRLRGLLASGHQEASGETVVTRWTLAQLLDSLRVNTGLKARTSPLVRTAVRAHVGRRGGIRLHRSWFSGSRQSRTRMVVA
jgi:hypothetical protein